MRCWGKFSDGLQSQLEGLQSQLFDVTERLDQMESEIRATAISTNAMYVSCTLRSPSVHPSSILLYLFYPLSITLH
jgi:hypothetical protein